MSLLSHRVRGFRLVDLMALGVLIVLVLGVYLAKTIAGRERAEIARVERQIDAEKARIRLLQAEVSHLEQPARIERLSSAYLGLQPVSIRREARAEDLPVVAGRVTVEAPKNTRKSPVELAAAEAAKDRAIAAINAGAAADEVSDDVTAPVVTPAAAPVVAKAAASVGMPR